MKGQDTHPSNLHTPDNQIKLSLARSSKTLDTKQTSFTAMMGVMMWGLRGVTSCHQSNRFVIVVSVNVPEMIRR